MKKSWKGLASYGGIATILNLGTDQDFHHVILSGILEATKNEGLAEFYTGGMFVNVVKSNSTA